ncbi:MAG: tRNA lysidine(34) synthetase TilS [Bacteroidaceae bacterium]|nr:tRNA lysidine(34) synthetase TilS [Bacteroidaceae bacterium]
MILSSVQQILDTAAITRDGDALLVALSGGADSVCLLMALQELGYPVEAMHCNFELRGVASDGDEAFCRRLCRARGVTLHVRHFRTRSYAARHVVSIEMAARELRYRWFAEVAAERGAQAICVAHHRDDNIETLLLNLVRGTGIHGLTGMRPLSTVNYQLSARACSLDTSRTLDIPLLRPLLAVSRAEIETFLSEREQSWVTDHTNLDPDAALRNKIRLQLLPLMEEMNPRVRETLAETAERLTAAEALYNDAVHDIQQEVRHTDGSLSVPALKQATSSEAVLHETLHPLGFSTEQVREIHEGMEGDPGKLWESREGWRLLRDRGRLLMQDAATTAPAAATERVLPLEGLYEAPYGVRLLIRRQAIDPATFEIPRDAATACFDLERLTLPLGIRVVREGDRFQPFGMNGTRLLSDFLTDRKLSLFDKERQLVVTSGDRIVWVVGQRAAAGYEVGAATRHVMTLTLL